MLSTSSMRFAMYVMAAGQTVKLEWNHQSRPSDPAEDLIPEGAIRVEVENG